MEGPRIQLSVRSCISISLAVLTAGMVAVAPVEISPGPVAPRVITAVKLVAAPGGFEGGWATEVISPLADLFDPAHSYTYVPNGSGPSVTHPVGLIPQLLQDAKNPPILRAIKSAGSFSSVLVDVNLQTTIKQRIAEYQTNAAAAKAEVARFVGHAVHDTFTPSQWGGGKVLNDWANAAKVREAMTIGVGAKVNDKWVPSIRVAAISTRNQIADDILGTQTYSNYVQHYKVVLLGEVVSAGAASPHMAASTGSPKPAASRRR